MQRPAAICFGEALLDHHRHGVEVAGAPLHVAAHLAAFGWHSYLLSRVGKDLPGTQVFEAVADHGIDSGLIQIDTDAPTGSAIIRAGEDGIDRFDLEYPAAWDRIETPAQLPNHRVLYFGTVAGRDQVSRRTMFAIGGRSDAQLKVCDVNLRAPWVNGETIDWVLENATILKCSSDELDELSKNGPEQLLRDHSQLDLVAVTSGSDGASLHRRGSRYHVAAPEVDVVDTVGAGDAFTAGLIDGLARNVGDEEALRQAVSIASIVVSSRGGLPG